MTETDILNIFKKSGALLTGHFLLTSGRHSDRYFQCAKVLQYPEYTEVLCKMIADNFRNTEIDTVIAPAIGGLVVGQEVARQLNKRFIFAEREDKNFLSEEDLLSMKMKNYSFVKMLSQPVDLYLKLLK